MIMNRWFLVMIGAAVLASASFAQTTPAAPPAQKKGRIAARKAEQQKRIGQGVQSGQLTAHETAKIERKETAINREVARDRAANDGKLTPAEKAKVNHQQNKVSRQIYREKHDGQHQ